MSTRVAEYIIRKLFKAKEISKVIDIVEIKKYNNAITQTTNKPAFLAAQTPSADKKRFASSNKNCSRHFADIF